MKTQNLISSIKTKIRFLGKDIEKLEKTLEEEKNMKKAKGIEHYESTRDSIREEQQREDEMEAEDDY